MLSTALAAPIVQAVCHPFETVRTRILCGQRGGSGSIFSRFNPIEAAASAIVYYKTSYAMVDFMQYLFPGKKDAPYPVATRVAVRMMIDITANLAILPFDTLRRRMIMAPADAPYPSSYACVQEIGGGGVKEFFAGAGMVVCRSMVSTLVSLFVADRVKEWYARRKVAAKEQAIKLQAAKLEIAGKQELKKQQELKMQQQRAEATLAASESGEDKVAEVDGDDALETQEEAGKEEGL